MSNNTKPPPRMPSVVRSDRLSPNMMRITFGGDALTGFPQGAESANVKLLLPHDGQSKENYLASVAGSGEKPLKRTYTVLEYRQSVNELDIDFALHNNPGPATRWALESNIGDTVAIAGPGRTKLANPAADWFLFAGDMSAMPAIITNLKTLPENASGAVFIEIIDDADKRHLDLPANIHLQWIINPDPHADKRMLVQAIKTFPWIDGTPAVWMAGESNCAREIRDYLANVRNVNRNDRYTSGYWQIGHNEDSFQSIKRSDPID